MRRFRVSGGGTQVGRITISITIAALLALGTACNGGEQAWPTVAAAPVGTGRTTDVTPAWSAAQPVTDAGGGLDPRVAVDATGTTALLVWIRDSGNGQQVVASVGTIGASSVTWTAPRPVSAPGEQITWPVADLDAAGRTAVVAWARRASGQQVAEVAIATIPTPGDPAWSTPVQTDEGDDPAWSVTADLAADGSVAVVGWQAGRRRDAPLLVRTLRASANDRSDGPEVQLGATTAASPDGSRASEPVVSVDDRGGRVAAIWLDRSATPRVVRAATASLEGDRTDWGLPATLSDPTTDADSPKLTPWAGDRVAGAWADADGTSSVAITVNDSSSTWADLGAPFGDRQVRGTQVALSDTTVTAVAAAADGTSPLGGTRTVEAGAWSELTFEQPTPVGCSASRVATAATTTAATWFCGTPTRAELLAGRLEPPRPSTPRTDTTPGGADGVVDDEVVASGTTGDPFQQAVAVTANGELIMIAVVMGDGSGVPAVSTRRLSG